MAPLPVNTTARLWLDYVTQSTGIEHTVLIRMSDASVTRQQEAQTAFLSFLQAMGAGFLRQGWQVIRARAASQGSDVSLPVPVLPALQSFVGTSTATWTRQREAIEVRFVGRSVTGRRVSLSLYGVAATTDVGNFRIEGAASGTGLVIRNGVNALNSSPTDVFEAIDGTEPIWYDYANIQYNSYWERRIRVTS